MDGVPIAFCDHLCDLLGMDALQGAKELSGLYGQLAQCTFEHAVDYICSVEDGIEEDREVRYEWNDRKVEAPKIDDIPKKFVREVWVYLLDAKHEKVSRELVRRFPYATYHFVLTTSSINEAWVDVALSLNKLQRVWITKKLDDDALRLFQKLVKGKKLCKLFISPEACEGGTVEVQKSLLLQEQFDLLEISNLEHLSTWNTAPVREILEYWTENSEEVRGKRLIVTGDCKKGVKQLEKFLLKGARSSATLSLSKGPSSSIFATLLRIPGVGSLLRRRLRIRSVLKVCSKEECDFIDKYYLHNYYTFCKPSCVYKYEEGDEEAKRRLYISFECDKDGELHHMWRPASHNGLKDLALMRDTCFLHILFA
uniref:FBA_2 domain-containing protein n=1 Tax=Steinernema glaseri TaxID=37863 RepID=A0A1I8ALI3_9BILA